MHMPCALYRHSTRCLSDALLDQARSKKVRFQATPDIIRSGQQAGRSRLTKADIFECLSGPTKVNEGRLL